MAQLKVVHISTYAYGGAGIAAYRIHEALLQNNIESFFLCLDRNDQQELKSCFQIVKPKLNLVQRAIGKFIRIIDRYCSLGKILPRKFYIGKLKKLLPSLICDVASLPYSKYNILEHPIVKNADLIHLHWVAGMLDYPSFFRLNTKPVVWTMHDMNPAIGLFHYEEDRIRNYDISSGIDDAILEIKSKIISQRKCQLYAVSPSLWLLNEASKSRVLKDVNRKCIYYTLNTNIFCPQVNNNLRYKLNIPETNTIFLFVSQTIPHYRKGFDLLVDALSKMKGFSITLLIIGYSADLELENTNIINLGGIFDNDILRSYYSLADAFIIPSREDNLPNVMLESMACGTPVLSFNVGGMAEVIQDNVNGLKSPELTSKGLQKIMEQFLEDKAQFDATSIRKFALENFSNKGIANKYTAVYTDMLSTE